MNAYCIYDRITRSCSPLTLAVTDLDALRKYKEYYSSVYGKNDMSGLDIYYVGDVDIDKLQYNIAVNADPNVESILSCDFICSLVNVNEAFDNKYKELGDDNGK
ncbi:hypothetical protein [Peromfec virus RodF8_42]|uniref:Uncharacterized protein n=1 Tax=Peromfec virus RodF8_42 TaxID=2929375 RepID=A0A976R888_9VIRU|nr:hypothetical protein [Peromfec virus RodF8_42]